MVWLCYFQLRMLTCHLQMDSKTGNLVVQFPSRQARGPPRSVEFSARDELELAYAITVHKAQGSEYDVVIIPVTHLHENMLTRPLVYTALTRAKRLLVCVGERPVLFKAIRRAEGACLLFRSTAGLNWPGN